MDSLLRLTPRAQSSADYHNTVTCNLIYANSIYEGNSGGSVVKLEVWECKSQHCYAASIGYLSQALNSQLLQGFSAIADPLFWTQFLFWL